MTVADPARRALRRRLTIIAPVSLRFTAGVHLFSPGAARPVAVEVIAARAGGVQLVEHLAGAQHDAARVAHRCIGDHRAEAGAGDAPQLPVDALFLVEGSVRIDNVQFPVQGLVRHTQP